MGTLVNWSWGKAMGSRKTLNPNWSCLLAFFGTFFGVNTTICKQTFILEAVLKDPWNSPILTHITYMYILGASWFTSIGKSIARVLSPFSTPVKQSKYNLSHQVHILNQAYILLLQQPLTPFLDRGPWELIELKQMWQPRQFHSKIC